MPYNDKVSIETQRFFFRKALVPERLKNLFFILFSLCLIILDHQFHQLDTLKFFVGSAVRPVQEGFIDALHFPYQTFSSFSHVLSNEKKLEQVSRELLKQKEQEHYIHSLEKENSELTALLHFQQSQTSTHLLASRIISVTHHPFIAEITLNKGLADNVTLGNPVLGEQGLIGQVTRLYQHYSEARLLTEIHQSTPVEILPGHATGIAFGHGSVIKIQYLSPNPSISVGDSVVTSGLDNLYPRYLKVAVVSDVSRNNDKVITEVLAKPLATDTISPYVTIITSSQKLTLGEEKFVVSRT